MGRVGVLRGLGVSHGGKVVDFGFRISNLGFGIEEAEKLSDLCALGLRSFSEGGSPVKKILSPLQG